VVRLLKRHANVGDLLNVDFVNEAATKVRVRGFVAVRQRQIRRIRGQKHIGVQRAPCVDQHVAKSTATTDVIVLSKETRITIVAAWPDARRYIRQMNSAADGP